VPALFLDAGNLFTDDRFSADQLPADVMTKNKWVVKSYGDFNHDAGNVSYADLPYMAELLKRDGYDERIREYPFIKKLVSANITPLSDLHVAPEPYLIREITLKRGAPGKTLRVGILGLTMPKPVEGGARLNEYAGFRIGDPFEAAKRVLPELDQKTDLIVVLAYMPLLDAQRLASENLQIDSIIYARENHDRPEVQHFGRAKLVSAFHETKYLGELRVYMNGEGVPQNQTNRYVELDSVIPDDPKASEAVTAAHAEFTNEQNRRMRESSAALPASLSTPSTGGGFAGAQACAACHQEAFQIWQNTGHAHAMETLERKNQHFDNECVGCHVVGFGQGGFQSLVTTPQLKDVQCEACHGPGLSHVNNPGPGYGLMQVPVGCTKCHTVPNTPDFNFDTYWPKIKH
jgi:2',3'-cyclic-nucleotide 2'-phosphodiesterase (5'-nucleotidase family)